MRIADPAVELQDAGRLFGRQARYVGHAGLRRWIAVASSTASDAFISLGDVRRERSGAILVVGELVVGRRAVTPLALLLSARDGAITTVHAYLSDEATLKRIGRIDP